MSIDTEALKSGVDLVSLVGHFTALKKRGAEYVGLCVAHADSNPSMWVNPRKGFVHCFSCGFNADAIQFVMHMEGLDFKAACERLGAKNDWTPRAPIAQSAPPRPDRTTSKPPADAGEPDMAIRALGTPSRTWAYRDAGGALLGYVARYETDEGKQIRCWSWGARGDEEPSWGCGHWNAPRPLYGLEKLAERPDAPVLLVEGEKAADAAEKLLAAYVVMTWAGGSQAWHRADLKPLSGRSVLLWPDADRKKANAEQAKKYGIKEGDLIPYEAQPGPDAMSKLAAQIADPAGYACKVKILDVRDVEQDGFDAADWTGTGEELIAWAKPRAELYESSGSARPPVEPMVDTPQESTEPPPAEFPPEATLTERPARPSRSRPRLAAVDGNTALAEQPEAEPLPPSMSEDFIADAFAEEHERDWRYVSQWDAWLNWDGDGWRKDRKELIDRLAVEMCRRACTWSDAASMSPDAKRRLGQRRTAGAVRDLARHDRRIAATADGWDADPLLVGIPGGVFDVKAGKIILGERDQYITRRTTVAPAPGAPKRWLEHMRRMMDGDEALIDFLQLYAGYCATGDTREQCFVFLYGMGQTGKGTFLLTLAELLGDYAAMSAASTFMSTQNEKHSSEIARLAGCRLVVIDETDGTARWNEERIKRMTGGGKITAARKYQDEEDIHVTWKLAFAGNHKPALRGVGKEMERRIRLVKCNASIPDEAVDRNFRAQMIAEEGPQILQWIFDGAVRWFDGGLPLPESIADATRAYLDKEDVIGDWMGECCEERAGLECVRPTAYRNYHAWAEKRGDRPWGNRSWLSALEDRGFTDKKRHGVWYVQGLGLKQSDQADGYDVG